MSEVEVNKGKLIPIEIKDKEEFAKQYVTKLHSWNKTYWDRFKDEEIYDTDYEYMNGQIYKVEWEIKGGEPSDHFCEVNENEDGSIEFHTMHYNGGGHWTEVVDEGIKQKQKGNE